MEWAQVEAELWILCKQSCVISWNAFDECLFIKGVALVGVLLNKVKQLILFYIKQLNYSQEECRLKVGQERVE